MSSTLNKALDKEVVLWSGSESTGTFSIASGYSFDDFKTIRIQGGYSTEERYKVWTEIPASSWADGEYASPMFAFSAWVAVLKNSSTSFTIECSANTSYIFEIRGVY